jgi:hypothetical protein
MKAVGGDNDWLRDSFAGELRMVEERQVFLVGILSFRDKYMAFSLCKQIFS